MKFIETKIKGAYLIGLDKIEDNRGFFARTWCGIEFKEYNLNPNLSQISIAFNKNKGTIRGMHYQLHPHKETKLVRCTRGAIYDVILDLRENSKTFMNWISLEINENNFYMIYVPEGCAHGYQTLENNTEVIYHMSVPYVPEFYHGVRWNDSAFNIKWPYPTNIIISEKDKNYPDFKLAVKEGRR